LLDDVSRRADGGPVALAVEGCTGWRYVVEEIKAAGFEAHLAEPADTQAARGRKHRAKTDRTDARLLRDLLVAGELPESWIPPDGVLEWRERVRLYLSLVNQRTVWCQRIHAELYQHGVAIPEGAIRTPKTRAMLADDSLRLSPAARQPKAQHLSHLEHSNLPERHRLLPRPLTGTRRVHRQRCRRWWIPRGGPITGAGVVPLLALGWSHAAGATHVEVVPWAGGRHSTTRRWLARYLSATGPARADGGRCAADRRSDRRSRTPSTVVSRMGGSEVGVVSGQFQHPVPMSGHRRDRTEAL